MLLRGESYIEIGWKQVRGYHLIVRILTHSQSNLPRPKTAQEITKLFHIFICDPILLSDVDAMRNLTGCSCSRIGFDRNYRIGCDMPV
jgi:hypothetical protein